MYLTFIIFDENVDFIIQLLYFKYSILKFINVPQNKTNGWKMYQRNINNNKKQSKQFCYKAKCH